MGGECDVQRGGEEVDGWLGGLENGRWWGLLRVGLRRWLMNIRGWVLLNWRWASVLRIRGLLARVRLRWLRCEWCRLLIA